MPVSIESVTCCRGRKLSLVVDMLLKRLLPVAALVNQMLHLVVIVEIVLSAMIDQ